MQNENEKEHVLKYKLAYSGRAGDVYLVISVSKDHIEKLAEITPDQLAADTVDTTGQKIDMVESFHDILDKVKHHLPKK